MDNRAFVAACILLGCISSSTANFHCGDSNRGEVCHIKACTDAIKNHIKEEFSAAFKYMEMGAYFSQETVARPGMANFMLDSASEERSHGILMLDYLNKRGGKITREESFSFNLSEMSEDERNRDISVLSALETALEMEIGVTRMIYHVIKACEEDFHAADVFTNPILEEQHDGIRKLQGAIRDYNNLGHKHLSVGMVEYLFDHKVLKESI